MDSLNDNDLHKTFMARFELNDAQYTTLATYLAIMARKTDLTYRAKEFKITRSDLEKNRSHVFDLVMDISKTLDAEAEETGENSYTISENGVDVFSHEKLSRSAILALDGIHHTDVESRFEFKAGTAEIISALFERRLLYMGAVAIKANPCWNALEVMKSMSKLEEFSEWNDRTISYIDEDESAIQAEQGENK